MSMSNRTGWLVLLLVGLLAAPGAAALGGEPEPGAEAPPKKARKKKDRKRNPDFKRIKEIFKKRQAGEELTAEEKALLQKFQAERGKRAGAGGGRPAGLEGLELVNAIDAVKMVLAQAHLGRGQTDKAVEVLNGVVEKSPEETAVGFARLALARIYRGKGENAKAQAELKKVEGPAIIGALAMMLAGAKDQTGKLETLLEEVRDPLARAVILRRLSMTYLQKKDSKKLAALAERAAKLLTYKQAVAALEVERKLRERLGKGGRPKRGGKAGKGKAGWAGGAQVEKLKKEIKELEDAGLVKEAGAKQQELKALWARLKGKGKGKGKGLKKEVEPVPAGDDIF